MCRLEAKTTKGFALPVDKKKLQETGLSLSASWLDFMDFISEGVAMPLGALVMSVLVGWVIGPKVIQEEVCAQGRRFQGGLCAFFSFCIRFVAPAGMLMILVGQLLTFFAPAA